MNRKTETKSQQTTALRFPSSVLTATGKSDYQFSKFYNINRTFEPDIPGSIYQFYFSFVNFASSYKRKLNSLLKFGTKECSY